MKLDLDQEKICDLYQSGLSLREIGKMFDVSLKPVLRILKINGIERRQSTYSLTDRYFEYIDTHNKAYILGLAYADGSVSIPQHNFCIRLQELDKYILEKINILLGSNRELYFISKYKENWQNCYSLSITNKIMCLDLINHGVVPNKSFLIRFPNIEDKFIFDFLRGFFDGDGCVYTDKRKKRTGAWTFTSNMNFCLDVQKILEKYNIDSRIYQNKTHHKQIAELRIGKIEYIKKIFDLTYKNSNGLYLTRKYDKLLNLIGETK